MQIFNPIPVVSGSSVTEWITDPNSPTPQQIWILDTGAVGTAGQAMGLMGLPYSKNEVQFYDFNVAMSNGDIKRVRLL